MSYGIRHKKLDEQQRAVVCVKCGHTQGEHENPDTCCLVDGCGCQTFQSKEISYENNNRRKSCV